MKHFAPSSLSHSQGESLLGIDEHVSFRSRAVFDEKEVRAFHAQSLRNFDEFTQFYVLFHRQGLIDDSFLGPPRAVALLKQTAERQREVGDQLYQAYSENRNLLIQELHHKRNYSLDQAIEMAQACSTASFSSPFARIAGSCRADHQGAYKVAGIHAVTNPAGGALKYLFP